METLRTLLFRGVDNHARARPGSQEASRKVGRGGLLAPLTPLRSLLVVLRPVQHFDSCNRYSCSVVL